MGAKAFYLTLPQDLFDDLELKAAEYSCNIGHLIEACIELSMNSDEVRRQLLIVKRRREERSLNLQIEEKARKHSYIPGDRSSNKHRLIGYDRAQ